ncbi:MAG: proton-conducting transporter membrane subunit, partial [Myxococcota bacterium]
PALPFVLEHAPQPLVVLAAAMAGGVVPFNLWLSGLERRARPLEFQVVLLGQPGLVWLHRFVSTHGDALHGTAHEVLLWGFVSSALLKTGLGLVRREPRRALSALVVSQSMLALAGAVTGESGWAAARLLWVAMATGTVVLQGVVFELERTYGITRLAPDHGLAAAEPALHRLFVTMGWLMVGVPGGVAFFAEDLLFHSVVEESGAATFAFLLSAALNAAVFYRVYVGLFSGPTTHPVAVPVIAQGRRWVRRRWTLAVMLAAVLVVLVGGLWPAFFL